MHATMMPAIVVTAAGMIERRWIFRPAKHKLVVTLLGWLWSMRAYHGDTPDLTAMPARFSFALAMDCKSTTSTEHFVPRR